MKKIITFTSFLFFSVTLYSNILCSPYNGVNIEIDENCYIIDVVYPPFTIVESHRFDNFIEANQAYCYADFNVADDNNYFQYMQWLGGPSMPFISLNLQVPSSSSIQTNIEIIQFSDTFDLNYIYEPYQNIIDTGSVLQDTFVAFDETLYFHSELLEPVSISSRYKYMGTDGISIKLKPFLYDYRNSRIYSIHHIRYIVCVWK